MHVCGSRSLQRSKVRIGAGFEDDVGPFPRLVTDELPTCAPNPWYLPPREHRPGES